MLNIHSCSLELDTEQVIASQVTVDDDTREIIRTMLEHHKDDLDDIGVYILGMIFCNAVMICVACYFFFLK